jgi:hypothetical protein
MTNRDLFLLNKKLCVLISCNSNNRGVTAMRVGSDAEVETEFD